MAAAQVVSIGVGSPASIPNFLTFGLSGVGELVDDDVPTVIVCVPRDGRVLTVRDENRVLDVGSDNRTIYVKRQRGCC